MLRALRNPARLFSVPVRTMSSALTASLDAQLAEMRAAGTHKTERVITSAQGARVTTAAGGAPVLNMCANNYLGLSNHPALVAAAQATLSSHGFGLSSVRFICGTQDIHKQLEARIAAFHGMEDAILFPSCFDANAGIFEAILGPGDAVISDEKNHASISAFVHGPGPRRGRRPEEEGVRRAPRGPRHDDAQLTSPPPPPSSLPSLSRSRRHPALQGDAAAVQAPRHGRPRGAARRGQGRAHQAHRD
jgi:hypothetical protein